MRSSGLSGYGDVGKILILLALHSDPVRNFNEGWKMEFKSTVSCSEGIRNINRTPFEISNEIMLIYGKPLNLQKFPIDNQ